MKNNKHVKIEKKNGKEIISFSPMYDVKTVRRELPPPTRVEKPKKGKGSYSRKPKHKDSSRNYNDSGTIFFISSFLSNFLFLNRLVCKSVL